MPLDDIVDQLRALNFDLARFSSDGQKASIEAAATEIERLRACTADDEGAEPPHRPTPIYVWRDEDGRPSFDRPRHPVEVVEVEVPGNWIFKSYRHGGIILVEYWCGDALDAGAVVLAVERGLRGFRFGGWQATREKNDS